MSSNSEQGYAEMVERLPAPTRTPADCPHDAFAACAAVTRLEDTGRFVCELRVLCTACREPFRFQGLAPGVFNERPSCSIDGLEANLPIEPEVRPRLFAGARFEMPPVPVRH